MPSVKSLVLGIACFLPATLLADSIVASHLNLTQFQITPASGTVSILPPTTASAYAAVIDSLLNADSQFNSADDSDVLAMAIIALANSTTSASASGLTTNAAANVNIPEINASAGTDTGASY